MNWNLREELFTEENVELGIKGTREIPAFVDIGKPWSEKKEDKEIKKLKIIKKEK